MIFKKPILALCALALVITSTSVATAATKKNKPKAQSLEANCPTIRAIKPGEIWKSIASNHIGGHDPRSKSTSFILTKRAPAISATCLNVYDSEGTKIHTLGKYYPTGHLYNGRFYGGHGCGDGKTASGVRKAAIKNTEIQKVYVDVGKTCIEIQNPAKCYNSTGC